MNGCDGVCVCVHDNHSAPHKQPGSDNICLQRRKFEVTQHCRLSALGHDIVIYCVGIIECLRKDISNIHLSN